MISLQLRTPLYPQHRILCNLVPIDNLDGLILGTRVAHDLFLESVALNRAISSVTQLPESTIPATLPTPTF